MSSPPQDPEKRTSTLSPVSPKPMQVPAPSNIALLENQMDPNFDGGDIGQPKNPSNSTVVKPTGAAFAAAADQEKSTQTNSTLDEGVNLHVGPSVHLADNQSNGISASNAVTPSFTQPDSLPNLNLNALNGQSDTSAQAEFPNIPHIQETSTGPSAVDISAPLTDPFYGLNEVQPPQNQLLASGATSAPSLPTNLEIQALLDNLNASANASTAPTADPLTATVSQPAEPGASETLLHADKPTAIPLSDALPHAVPNAPTLPPRPPSQPTSHDATVQQPSSSLEQPHALIPEKISSSVEFSFAPLANAAPPPLPTAGAPGVHNAPSTSLPPPPLPSFQTHSPGDIQGLTTPVQSASTLSYPHQGAFVSRPGEDITGIADGENDHWDRDTQRKYDDFLADERRYVLEGQWDKFPSGSRLFLGNLPSEKVTKRDLFHVFHRHGKLAQISIKQAYGFIQYLDAEHCARAKAREQGVAIRGKAINLEISVPGGKKRNQQTESRSSRNRRSRSPQGSRNGGRNSRSDNQHRTRSPNRNRVDHYDPRSPRAEYSNVAKMGTNDDNRLPLPYRQPSQIPEVQVIAKEPLEKQFVQYVEASFKNRSIHADVLFLSPGLDEHLVVRRQIVEGVLAVMKIDRLSQTLQKFHLTIFDRSAGVNNVKFEEYNDVQINVVVELVARARQNAHPSVPPTQYGYHSSATPQQSTPYSTSAQPSPTQPFPSPAQSHQGVQQPIPSPSSITQMDNQALQGLLQALSTQPRTLSTAPQAPTPQSYPTPQTQPSQGNTPDINQILRAMNGNSPQQQLGQAQQLGLTAQPSVQQPSAQHSLQSSTPSATDIAQIMAQLNRYGR